MSVFRQSKDSEREAGISAAGIMVAAGIILILAVGGYFLMSLRYKDAFFPRTTVNGTDVSGKSAEEARQLIAAGIDDYVLTLVERGDKRETITKDDIGLVCSFDGSMEELIGRQNPYAWLYHMVKSSSHEIDTMISYDEGLFDETLKGLDCFDETKVKVPEDARISEYVSGKGYSIIPEEQGNEAVYDIVWSRISQAVKDLESTVSIEEIGGYRAPGITADNEALTALLDTMNLYTGLTVTYQFGNSTEKLDGDTISQWLSVSEDQQAVINRDAAADYVKALAKKYNTAYQPKTLKTSYGPTVRITAGNYGWRISQSAETDELIQVIKAGESVTREPVYAQRALSHEGNDYSDTYVEINLTAQHLFFYKNGKLLVESDFVSGNLAKKYDTPVGAYPITYKQRDATLKGQGYSSPVSYWMPFNGGVGMHDAGWRSTFGGSIYKTNGSHGCVNLPPNVAKTIYENIEAGMPVLCYELEGTESKKSTGGNKKPAETTAAVPAETTQAPPETTAAPETTAPPETTAAPETTAPAETTKAPEPAKVPETTAASKKPSGSKGPGDGSSSGSNEKGPGM